jgi:alpha-tubulin suppressor-like RCC1 family protein
VLGLPPDVAAVGAGHFHSFAVSTDGELWSWGRNVDWALGRALDQGEFQCSPTPARVVGLERHEVAAATGSGVASFAVRR